MREELDDTPDDMLDAAPQRADRGEVFCHPERVEHAMRMMWRSQLRGRGRNIMLARQRNEERVARALRFGAPETAAVAAVAHPSTTGAHRTAGASSARVEEVLRTNIRKPGAGVIEAFEKTGYLASAQQQLDLGYT